VNRHASVEHPVTITPKPDMLRDFERSALSPGQANRLRFLSMRLPSANSSMLRQKPR
jgi:hypothetical protein